MCLIIRQGIHVNNHHTHDSFIIYANANDLYSLYYVHWLRDK